MNKTALIILDGWGIGKGDASDGIASAKTPFFDALKMRYPTTTLTTFGEDVGLPEGQMGNSEVGHMNIGAGRVVYQDLVRINLAISDRSFFENEVLHDALSGVGNGTLHLMGLIGEGGVHSSQKHLHALIQFANQMGVKKVAVHAFMDGRDSDPHAGLHALDALEAELKEHGGRIATVIGRYYAMDRDKRWERVAKAYRLLVNGEGSEVDSARAGVEQAYANGQTDEFIEPLVVRGGDFGQINEGDTVVCFNFRTDRCREITMALTQQAFPEEGMAPLQLRYCTMTRYDASFKNVMVAYEKDDLAMTLGEVVSQAGGTQLRIAETEKYPHVTFFFSGGREAEFAGEARIMVNSPKVATYDLQPEMSAREIARKAADFMASDRPDLVVLNFANPDMVGHTGVFSAIVEAVEVTDACLQTVVEAGLKEGYRFVVIADHGNADCAINEDGTVNTAHTLNPVPMVVIDDRVESVEAGRLADVAPTLLAMLGVERPAVMTGRSLVKLK